MRRIILAIAVLCGTVTFALAQPGGRGGPVTPNPDIRLPPFAPSTAATTFNSNCVGCHGNNLEGTPRGRSLFNGASPRGAAGRGGRGGAPSGLMRGTSGASGG